MPTQRFCDYCHTLSFSRFVTDYREGGRIVGAFLCTNCERKYWKLKLAMHELKEDEHGSVD